MCLGGLGCGVKGFGGDLLLHVVQALGHLDTSDNVRVCTLKFGSLGCCFGAQKPRVQTTNPKPIKPLILETVVRGMRKPRLSKFLGGGV